MAAIWPAAWAVGDGQSVGSKNTKHAGSDMRNCKKKIMKFINDESGQDLIEYALVTALIALGCVAAMNTLATTIGTAFATVGTKLTTSL
jgi:pilus assembly protein Flp/PilA